MRDFFHIHNIAEELVLAVKDCTGRCSTESFYCFFFFFLWLHLQHICLAWLHWLHSCHLLPRSVSWRGRTSPLTTLTNGKLWFPVTHHMSIWLICAVSQSESCWESCPKGYICFVCLFVFSPIWFDLIFRLSANASKRASAQIRQHYESNGTLWSERQQAPRHSTRQINSDRSSRHTHR